MTYLFRDLDYIAFVKVIWMTKIIFMSNEAIIHSSCSETTLLRLTMSYESSEFNLVFRVL